MHRPLIPVFFVLVIGSALAADTGHSAISPLQAKAWILHAVPLPKSIEISSKVAVPRCEVAIVAPGKSDPVIEQACRELWDAIRIPETGKGPEKSSFAVNLQLGGAEAESLRALKNSDQAYSISPEANDAGLRLVALTPRGLYYAAKTLQQLMNARATPDAVEMPIMRVTDWPDMEDRGLWGSDSYLQLKWLADRKMNYIEQISIVGVDEEGRAYAGIKDPHRPLLEEGPLYGIEFVPVVVHLEQVGSRGVFQAYPNLKGQSTHEGVICYSQPQFVDVLADWIAAFGSLPHVEDVDVWMTENLSQQGGCKCPECRKTDRGVLEARVIVAAWKKAREKVRGVGLRILTSEETEYSNRLIFHELPPEVKVWYYHSLLTYTTGETPVMWRKYLEDFARSGRWLGVCPNLDAAVHWTSPFTGADFVHYRMNEFVDKQLSGLIGYATPRVHYSRFNVEAAAEWSWNAKGRSPYEFALSWAVREGIGNPVKFAEWADTVGPIEWDVYGSHWPAGEQRNVPGPAAKRLREGTLPELGYVLWDAYRHPFGDVKSVEQLNGDVAAAERAVALAKEMGIPEFIHESLIAQGYINSLKALWELKNLVKPDGVAQEDREAARRYFEMYVDSLQQVTNELPKWEKCVPGFDPDLLFTKEPAGVMNGMIEQMEKVAIDLGFNVSEQGP